MKLKSLKISERPALVSLVNFIHTYRSISSAGSVTYELTYVFGGGGGCLSFGGGLSFVFRRLGITSSFSKSESSEKLWFDEEVATTGF